MSSPPLHRPSVVRTYGLKSSSSRPSSSASLFSAPTNHHWGSSSPPSSSLITPPPSPSHLPLSSSPLFDVPPSSDDQENVPEPSSSPWTFAPVHQRKDNQQLVSTKVVSQPTLKSFFAPLPSSPSVPKSLKRPRPLESLSVNTTAPPNLTQLHLTHLPLLHTCKECQMSYVRGGEDDAVHVKHHTQVVRGVIWDAPSKTKGKETMRLKVVEEEIHFGQKGSGRIIMLDASCGGNKMEEILRMVDTVLSSPPLPTAILSQCKVFLFLTSSPPSNTHKRSKPNVGQQGRSQKERVVGVVVAQKIKWAMRVLRPGEQLGEDVRVVDSGGGVICDPTPLPTPLGIHRLYTIPSYRSLGTARHLLDCAARHTVYGCTFDPTKGEAAFSQPTESGRRAMERWSEGNARVFVDDESQL
ncbi:hypothetical protein TREMEDRAFT_68850 [Tremella mesenterica DSM 1558]|uniref:uncharacterized protein n=1 Tax=Tremella mesenterica (strain ATCC 24925 / CBS 8224 / DSM 1558 / NBRC 9311 / NRRL Y-6157 / RJB 2259-6 / UBC 559-6) TaxID=578456 RepID=UPI0003F49668|nr:uncharacterized protein TREMEDRAFT_68850 [Tremella mesenterica DSM 1558]EIW68890.1 hypothetical protein TREMEDRAFT_68850 [Tremella mesenterica DSM 1558]